MIGNNLVLALGSLILNWQLVFWGFFGCFILHQRKAKPTVLAIWQGTFSRLSISTCLNTSLFLQPIASPQCPLWLHLKYPPLVGKFSIVGWTWSETEPYSYNQNLTESTNMSTSTICYTHWQVAFSKNST